MLTRPLQQASGQRVMAYRTINVNGLRSTKFENPSFEDAAV